jgi:8-oxo-dGTP pyrophosphatase MutT (NUDIX family)
VTPKGLVLTRTQRGVLEHLGGHREGNETVVATACREALEEGGLIVEHIALAAVRKVETDEAAREAPNRRPYPPLGFIPYFVAFSSLDLIPPNGLEVIDRVEMPILSALLSDSAQLPERQEAVLMIESLLAEKISKDSFNDETLTARLGTTLKKRGVCVLENGRESISNHIARDTGPHRHSR